MIIFNYFFALNSPDNDMMSGSRPHRSEHLCNPVSYDPIHLHRSSPVFQDIQQGAQPEHLENVAHQERTEVDDGTIWKFVLHTLEKTEFCTQDERIDLRVFLD